MRTNMNYKMCEEEVILDPRVALRKSFNHIQATNYIIRLCDQKGNKRNENAFNSLSDCTSKIIKWKKKKGNSKGEKKKESCTFFIQFQLFQIKKLNKSRHLKLII